MWELVYRMAALELASSYHADHTTGVASYPAGNRIYHFLSGAASYGDVIITTGRPGSPGPKPTATPAPGGCAIVGKVLPAKAKADGSQVIPPRVACQCGQEKVSFSAEAADGWALRGWDPGPKVQCPDSGEGEAVAIFMPTLTATGGRETAMCTAGEKMTRTVLDFGLTASQADSWQVTSMTFSASGSGDDGKAIKHVRLYRGGSKLGEKRYNRDDGTVKFTFPKILIPVGKTVTFRLEYEFAPREMKHCSVEKQIFGVTLASHNAEPVHFAPGMRSGSPMGQVVAGCVKLKSASGGFLDIYDTIQDAVDLASDGQLIEVCPGDYIENVLVDKSLTIRSIGSRNNTFVLAADANRPAIHIKKDNVTVDGFTIQRATGPEQAGVYVHGSVVQNTHILNNALSNNRYGLLLEATQGAEITDNLITTNKAHGVYLKNATQSVIQNNSLTDNQGDGILLKECQESADTWTSLQKNHVWGNGGSGIHLMGSQGVQINESATLSQNLEDGVLVESAAGAASVEHSMRVRITENATIQDNGRDGIRLKGGVDVEMRNNVIRENAVYGISVMDYAEDIRILGNTIAGNRRREEQIIGIYVTESGHVTIGSATNPNLIHSHKKYGVSLEQLTVPFDDGHAYLVTGNTIRANEGSGIHIEKACGVQVDGNTLGGKNGDGVQIVKSICMLETSNQILNNTIRQNLHHGVLIQESTESEIGLPGKGNIIKSNGGNGIELNQTASRMDAVNYIMSNTIRKNQMHGVALIKSKFDRVEERNQIEANGEDGVYLEQSNDIAVEGNVIEGMEEQKNGIHLVRSNDASIKFNTIKGHRTHGILIEQSNDGDANHLIQNIIRQNRQDGVHVQEACNVMIGDDSYKMGNNTIGPDNRVGVVITNCQCGDFNANVIANNQIQKNFSGVWVLNSEEVRIGAKNHILHHSSAGVMLWRSQGVVVKGNVIGPDNRNGIQIIQCQETEGKENEISDNEIKGNTNHDVFEESSNWLDISK
jgi:parallel beta-helix repeat protein